ncbi:helix-turn-helix domain-containing protein [Lacticaseibacillus baoqingensis]|uniref:Helix-turn-helix domain-containing protein n=1 Tax=Lacticaseibacillus baoqingensis TaxID=2486013 RepID=A0ABW4E9T4_9LACO|nr:AraC family transcriptional regulator [Lacticaseibacillus baoqingensis]
MKNGDKYQEKINVAYDVLTYKIGSYHYNWHHEIELLWLLTGEIEVNVEGDRHHLFANDMIVINSNKGHATFALQVNSVAVRLHIAPSFFISQGAQIGKGQIHLETTQQKNSPVFAQLRAYLSQLTLSTTRLQQSAAVYQIAASLYTNFFSAGAETFEFAQDNPVLKRATEYISRHYADDLRLDQLAQRYNYSSAYLSRLFKNELGINFYEFLVRCRLQHAVFDLTHSNDLIVDIAYQNGFHEVKAFNTMFKKHFGKTPSAYRQSITPEVLAEDHGFKQALSPADQVAVQAAFKQQLAQQRTPCDECTFHQDALRCHDLVTTLRPLLNRKN